MRLFPALFAVILIACDPAPDRRPDLDDKLARIDALVQRAFAVDATAGLGIGVAIDGRIEYTSELGFADVTNQIPTGPETLWYIASTSKSITGFAIALLAQRGELQLDDPIGKYLPDAQWAPGVDPADLTIADFLGHTTGLSNGGLVLTSAFTGIFPESEYGRLLKYSEQGSRELQYTNLGYNVAGMVIDALRPEGWKAFQQEHILDPAGLSGLFSKVSTVDRTRIAKPHDVRANGDLFTGSFRKRDRTMHAAGGHVGTITSLLRWTILHMEEGRIDGRQVFPREVVALSHKMLRSQDRQFAQYQRDGWAMGWDIGSFRGEPMISRFGSYSSTRSHLSFLPEQRVGVVAQTSGPMGSRVTDIVASYVYDVMLDHPDADSLAHARLEVVRSRVLQLPEGVSQFQEAQRERNQPYPHPLGAYVGDYEDDAYGAVSFRQLSDGLHMTWGVLEGPTTVFDAEANALRHELFGRGRVIRFVFDGGSHASAIDIDGRQLPFVSR